MEDVLITGATKGYGLAIAKELQSRGFRIWTLQRKPPRALFSDITELAEHWIDGDLENEANSLGAVSHLRARNITVKAVVHCARRFVSPQKFINSFEMKKTFQVNVLEPLALTKHLLQFGVLDWGGVALFMLDERSENIYNDLSKHILQPAVQLFGEREFPACFNYGFVAARPIDRLGEIDRVTEKVRSAIENPEKVAARGNLVESIY